VIVHLGSISIGKITPHNINIGYYIQFINTLALLDKVKNEENIRDIPINDIIIKIMDIKKYNGSLIYTFP